MMDKYPEKPVYIIDDELIILKSLSAVLRADGINNIETCRDSREAMNMISAKKPSLVLLDLTMPYVSGETLLTKIKDLYPDIPVLIITGINELSTAVECMKNGAADYLVKAIENNKLITTVRTALNLDEVKNENRLLKKTLLTENNSIDPAFDIFITKSITISAIFKYLSFISKTNQTVLIRGETGTGKELVAEALHKASGRKGDFVSINVSGLDDNMFSDTLFGHKKGAYSGADINRSGLIEKAADGTLFLDEIGDLSENSQIKLLRLLEKKEYYPLGSDVLKKASCRIIAATNSELEKQIEDGVFRKDLYYRLGWHEVMIPPLRQRKEDITALVYHFCTKLSAELDLGIPKISKEFIRSIYHFELKGNVRELMKIILRCLSESPDGNLTHSLLARLFPSELEGKELKDNRSSDNEKTISEELLPIFPERLPNLKQWSNMLVDEAMIRTEGNITEAAALLGISQPALSKRLANRQNKLI